MVQYLICETLCSLYYHNDITVLMDSTEISCKDNGQYPCKNFMTPDYKNGKRQEKR